MADLVIVSKWLTPWRVAFAHWGKAGIQRDVAEGEVWDENLMVNGVPTVAIAPIELDPKIARAIVEAHNSSVPSSACPVSLEEIVGVLEPFADAANILDDALSLVKTGRQAQFHEDCQKARSLLHRLKGEANG
jgi:hypothetical protein